MQKSAQFQHPAARLYVTYVSHNLPQKQWPRAYDWFCYAAARASTKYSLRIRSLASMYSLRIYGKLHCFSFYNKLLTAHMTTHTIGVLIKKMVCSLWRYPARMQTTPSVAEVLCFTSIDHIHIENITTAWRAGDMRHWMHQPNRGVHPLPAGSSCPPGWRTGPVAMHPAAAAVRRAPATRVYTAAPARPRHWRRGPRGVGAAGGDNKGADYDDTAIGPPHGDSARPTASPHTGGDCWSGPGV